MRRWSVGMGGLLALMVGLAAVAEDSGRVLIPFDLESTFDNGRYGAIVSDQIWTKIRQRGGFVLPESLQDVRDWCERNRVHPGPETSMDVMKRALRDQAGDIAIWGKIERVPGTSGDEYDLRLKVADFSTDPPKVIHDVTARTKTVSEIPHVYIKGAIDALYGEMAEVVAAEANDIVMPAGPNLVKGTFEVGRTGPIGWDPLPRFVTWVKASGADADGRSKVIRFTMDEATAGTTGVLYYSEPFPVEEGATYRFSCRWRSTGSSAKVFIKCYDDFRTSYQDAARKPMASQRREVYRSQQNLQGEPNVWNLHTEDFTPKHDQFTPKWGRVMLYAYWPAGVVEWDDVMVQKVAKGRR
jgi:hypothetical protein